MYDILYLKYVPFYNPALFFSQLTVASEVSIFMSSTFKPVGQDLQKQPRCLIEDIFHGLCFLDSFLFLYKLIL